MTIIVIFSKNNHLEDALRSFKTYQNLKIITTQDKEELKRRDRIFIVDGAAGLNKKCQPYINLLTIGEVNLKKPFHISSLNNLIISHLTKLNNYIFSNKFSFFYSKRLLVNAHDIAIKLTEKEASLLSFILKSPNFTISKSDALDKLWQYNITSETSTLETHTYLLKSKFEKLGFKSVLSIQKDELIFNI